MPVKLQLNSQAINDKVFKIVPRGYDALAVDTYLDKITADYESIESNCLLLKQEVDAYQKTIDNLKADIQRLELENGKYKNKLSDIKIDKNVTVDNLELIKRISRLEKFLWQNGFNPDTIK